MKAPTKNLAVKIGEINLKNIEGAFCTDLFTIREGLVPSEYCERTGIRGSFALEFITEFTADFTVEFPDDHAADFAVECTVDCLVSKPISSSTDKVTV